MRVLVTGGGGFVGGHIAVYLAGRGHSVFSVYRETRPVETPAGSDISLVQADLAAGDELPRALDAIVHCAAAIPARVPDDEDLCRINAAAMSHLCAHASAAGICCLLNMSSMAVYGEVGVDMVDETTPPREPGPYGRSKLHAETLAARWAAADSRRAALSLRLPGVVGRGSHDNFLSSAMKRIRHGGHIEATNPDAPFNNIVHVRELTGFVERMLSTLPAGYVAANLAAEAPMIIRSVLELMVETSGKPASIIFRTGRKRPFLIDFERARSLGFRPASVADSVRRFVRDALSMANGRG